MKLIHKDKIETTICPSGGFCRGEKCSAFNWWFKYETISVEYKWPNKKWWHTFRWIKAMDTKFTDFMHSAPPEVEGWDFSHHSSNFNGDLCYEYRRLNENAKWYCGLNVENG